MPRRPARSRAIRAPVEACPSLGGRTQALKALARELVATIERQRLAKIGDGAGLVAAELVGPAAVVVGPQIAGCQTDRLGKVANTLGRAAQQHVRPASILISICFGRVVQAD